jgi:hypothetical protein
MVMVTTFMAPPLLKLLLPSASVSGRDKQREAVEEFVTEA